MALFLLCVCICSLGVLQEAVDLPTAEGITQSSELMVELFSEAVEHASLNTRQVTEFIIHREMPTQWVTPEALADVISLLDCRVRRIAAAHAAHAANAAASSGATQADGSTKRTAGTDSDRGDVDGETAQNRLVNLAVELLSRRKLLKTDLASRLNESFVTLASILPDTLDVAKLRRVYVQTNTKHNLTQQKYNLLREESEGYTKLTAELCRPFDAATVDSIKSHVQSLIGYFDLDPHRVLDMILNCFDFHVDNPSYMSLLKIVPLNHLAALLGFKLAAYHPPASTEPAPRSLFILVAKLLHSRFLTLEEIYPHLSPTDDALSEETAVRQRDTASAMNKPMTIKKLMEGSESSAERDKRLGFNQKFRLLEALLRVEDQATAREGGSGGSGSIADNSVAQQLLVRLEAALPAQHGGVAAQLCRRITLLIDPMYNMISPKTRIMKPGQPLPSREQWSTLVTELFPALRRHLGCYLSKDTLLFCKVIRLLTSYVVTCKLGNASSSASSNRDEAEINLVSNNDRNDVFDVIVDVILPSLSIMDITPVAACEVWNLLKCFSYKTRYNIYHQWRSITRYPELNMVRADTANETRKVLRRLTADSAKSTGRSLGRLTHHNPIPVFDPMLSQVQSPNYGNLIQPLADSLKFLTPLSADVLSFCILDGLAQSRSPTKPDGTSVEDWLSQLASFAGSVYKRYGYKTDLLPVLTYVEKQLERSSPWHLMVLRELLTKMAGIEVQEDAYDDQLCMLNAGATLRAIALQGVLLQSGDKSRTSINALRASLLGNKLAMPLFHLICKQSDAIAFASDQIQHLKLIGDAIDKCHEVVLQFSEFLKTNVLTAREGQPPRFQLGRQQQAQILVPWPLFDRLCLFPASLSVQHVCHLFRPLFPVLFSDVINSGFYWRQDELVELRRQLSPSLPDAFITEQQPQQQQQQQDDQTTATTTEGGDTGVVTSLPAPSLTAPIPVPASSLVNMMRNVLPNASPFSVEFFRSFWALSLYDIHVPRTQYKEAAAKASASSSTTSTQTASKDNNSPSSAGGKSSSSSNSNSSSSSLSLELQRQEAHIAAITESLNAEKDGWFTATSTTIPMIDEASSFSSSVEHYVIHHCILPRAKYSAEDALYAAKFATSVIHPLAPQNWSTIRFFNSLFGSLSEVLFSCSENEAARFGRFLAAIMTHIAKWRRSQSTYERETSNTTTANTTTHAEFRKLTSNWERSTCDLFESMLCSSEFMEVRNALLVLNRLVQVFPSYKRLADRLAARIVSIMESDDTPDGIKLVARNYSARLNEARKSMSDDISFASDLGEPLENVAPPPPPPSAAVAVTVAGTATAAAGAAETDTDTKMEVEDTTLRDSSEQGPASRPKRKHPDRDSNNKSPAPASTSPQQGDITPQDAELAETPSKIAKHEEKQEDLSYHHQGNEKEKGKEGERKETSRSRGKRPREEAEVKAKEEQRPHDGVVEGPAPASSASSLSSKRGASPENQPPRKIAKPSPSPSSSDREKEKEKLDRGDSIATNVRLSQESVSTCFLFLSKHQPFAASPG
jgi:THO complex subunit 2